MLEEKNVSAIAEHAIKSQHHIDWKDIQVLDHEESWFERGVREATHIRINRASLNKDGGRHHPQVSFTCWWKRLVFLRTTPPSGVIKSYSLGSKALQVSFLF